METIVIRPIKRAEVDAVQGVFNHKDVIGGLGGFTMGDTVRGAAFNQRPGLWAAFLGDTPVGAFMVGGRPQVHLIKYGSVGVVTEYRRRRVSTALYFACTMQAITEGRRLFEDTIVGDNEAQHLALPSMGLSRSAELKHRTGSGKSIMIYQGSLMDDPQFYLRFLARTRESLFDFEWYIDSNSITRDWWAKNEDLASKYPETRGTFERIKTLKDLIYADSRVHVIQDRPVEQAPQKGQKKPMEQVPSVWENQADTQ